MIFNSFNFLWIFPLIFVVYFGLRRLLGGVILNKVSNYLLLIISYLVYAASNPIWCLYLFAITIVTYVSALVIENKQAYGKRLYIVIATIISLLPLGIFKLGCQVCV